MAYDNPLMDQIRRATAEMNAYLQRVRADIKDLDRALAEAGVGMEVWDNVGGEEAYRLGYARNEAREWCVMVHPLRRGMPTPLHSAPADALAAAAPQVNGLLRAILRCLQRGEAK